MSGELEGLQRGRGGKEGKKVVAGIGGRCRAPWRQTGGRVTEVEKGVASIPHVAIDLKAGRG